MLGRGLHPRDEADGGRDPRGRGGRRRRPATSCSTSSTTARSSTRPASPSSAARPRRSPTGSRAAYQAGLSLADALRGRGARRWPARPHARRRRARGGRAGPLQRRAGRSAACRDAQVAEVLERGTTPADERRHRRRPSPRATPAATDRHAVGAAGPRAGRRPAPLSDRPARPAARWPTEAEEPVLVVADLDDADAPAAGLLELLDGLDGPTGGSGAERPRGSRTRPSSDVRAMSDELLGPCSCRSSTCSRTWSCTAASRRDPGDPVASEALVESAIGGDRRPNVAHRQHRQQQAAIAHGGAGARRPDRAPLDLVGSWRRRGARGPTSTSSSSTSTLDRAERVQAVGPAAP